MDTIQINSNIPSDIIRPAFIIIDTGNDYLESCIECIHEYTENNPYYFVLTSNADLIKNYCKNTDDITTGNVSGIEVKFFYYMAVTGFDNKLIYYYLANITNTYKGEYTHFYILPDTFRLEHQFNVTSDIILIKKSEINQETMESILPKNIPIDIASFFVNSEKINDFIPFFIGGSMTAEILNDIMTIMYNCMNSNILLQSQELYLDIIIATEKYKDVSKTILDYSTHVDSWLNASVRMHAGEIELQRKSLLEYAEKNKDTPQPEKKETMKIQLSRANDYNHSALFFEMSKTCVLSLYNGFKIVTFEFNEN